MSTHRPVLDRDRPPAPRVVPSRGSRRAAIALVALACVPIVVATIRALMHHWIPLGDDGLLALRAQDVFSSHVPLLGTASSASFAATKPLNNPGPLYFDLLSIPVWAFGSAAGTAIGVALVNIGAVVAIGVSAWRRAGLVGAALGALVAATLAWSMGSELLFDVWQPHGLLLPFLAFLFVVWALAAGDLALVPIAVLIASLLMQTHLTYGYLSPTMLVVATVSGWWRTRPPKDPGLGMPPVRRGYWIAIGVVVGIVAWVPSIVEQLTTSDGNISRLLRELRNPPKQVIGGRGALRLAATVLARPPFWLRDSFGDTFHPKGTPYGTTAATVGGAGAVSFVFAAIAVGVVLACLIGVGLAARRRRDQDLISLAAVAALALTLSWYTASKVTTGIVGVAPHQSRFLWPLCAFLTFVVALAVARLASRATVRRVVVAASAIGVAVMSIWNLPTYAATAGPQLDESILPVERAIDRQLGAVSGSQPVMVEWSKLAFGEPFSGALMAEFRRRNIEFVTRDAYLIRQLGPDRASNGRDAKEKIFYRLGDTARSRRLGPFRRIAFHDGLNANERDQFARLRQALGEYLRVDGLSRTPKLQNGIDIGLWVDLRGPFTPEAIDRAFRSRALAGAVDAGALKVPAAWRARFAEYARLQARADRRTIGVYLGPVSAAAP